jgi:hypothetical protein
MLIEVTRRDWGSVTIERSIFEGLFENSIVRERAEILRCLHTSRIRFADLVRMARIAEIPYCLFFANQEFVDAQLRRKSDVLLAGISKRNFSMGARTRVHIADVELLVKDLIRKQQVLKKLDTSLTENSIVGKLRGSRGTVEHDAEWFRSAFAFPDGGIRGSRTKEAALEELIGLFEAQQIFVAQSQVGFMPQTIPTGVRFSGLTIRDTKIPFVFLSSGERDGDEPAGRRILTLVLMGVLVARARFVAVGYDNNSTEPISRREYELAEEVLMPSIEFRALPFTELDEIKAHADHFRVTPSAVLMRAIRLGKVSREAASIHFQQLRHEYSSRESSPRNQPLVMNAVRKYNSREYSSRMLKQLDLSRISKKEFCRVVTLNRIRPAQIDDYRAAL